MRKFTFLHALFLVLMALRLRNDIDLSWWYIFIPLVYAFIHETVLHGKEIKQKKQLALDEYNKLESELEKLDEAMDDTLKAIED